MKYIALCVFTVFLNTVFFSGHALDYAYSLEHAPDLQSKLDTTIFLDLRDMDVIDVYKFLALKGNFNVTISKNISGRVTLYLKEVSIRDALDIISLANNLGYSVHGDNIIYVMTEEEYMAHYGRRFGDKRNVKIIKLRYIKPAYAQEALRNIKSEIGNVVIDEETGSIVVIDTPDIIDRIQAVLDEIDVNFTQRVFTLRYADANDVALKLKESIDSKSVGSTQADTRSNQLIVSALPERMKQIEEFISALDRKTKAVLIDVKILKLILNPQFDMGIDWSSLLKKAHKITLSGSFPISSTVTQAGSFGEFIMGEGQENLAVDLKMLNQVSSTEILANPSIMVTNNEEAKIHIGDKLAYVTTTTIGTGDSQRVNEEVHYIDVGISLSVVPVINNDGFITMKLAPEISSKTGDLETPQKAQIPLINATSVQTEIIVKDGHTVVMGGLRQDHVIDSKKGLPFLMDIPFIGRAFSSVSKNKTQTEVAILLTPRIVTGEEDYAELRKETQQQLKQYKTY